MRSRRHALLLTGYRRGPYWSLFLSSRIHAMRRRARRRAALGRALACLPLPASLLVLVTLALVTAGVRCG